MGALLAWRWVAAAVGGVGRGVKAALGLDALAAGPLSPALPARVSGGALSEPQVREAAPGMGGREWPQRPLLCIIVTQAISCLEVWEKEKKKNPRWGQGSWAAASQKAASQRGRGCTEAVTCFHETPRVPGARAPARRRSLLQLWGVGKDGEGPPSGGIWAAAAGTAWSLQPARPLTCLFPSLQNCAELSSRPGQAEWAVLLPLFLPRVGFLILSRGVR